MSPLQALARWGISPTGLMPGPGPLQTLKLQTTKLPLLAVEISREMGKLSCPLAPTHLHKQGDGVESENFHTVHGVPGKDVQGPGAALHNLLHPYAILQERKGMMTGGPTPPHEANSSRWSLGAGLSCCSPSPEVLYSVYRGHPKPGLLCRLTHRVGLLCACSHMALGILVGLDQQLDQAGDDRGLLQWGMVGWAQGQVPDQANGCLVRKGK